MDENPVVSEFGFRNIQPRSRRERMNVKDKVALEKQRLNERVGAAARMNQINSHESSAGLVSCVENGAGYISNADRFHSDTSGEEYLRRQEENNKKQRALEFRKNQSVVREDDRWKRLEEQKNIDEERVTRLREEGMKAKKNFSGVSYDITNQHYHDTEAGKVQQYSDNMVRYRAEVRKHNLVVKGDTRVGYNIISGEGRSNLAVPEPLEPPEAIRTEGTHPTAVVTDNLIRWLGESC
eukprot:gene13127-27745_t